MTIRQDLRIRQGETWSFAWTKLDAAGNAVDLTGYSARAAIKRSLTASPDAYLSSGADASGGSIALGGAEGTVTLAMTADQSAALGAARSGEDRFLADNGWDIEPCLGFRYDLELVSGEGAVTRELEGLVVLEREVTS